MGSVKFTSFSSKLSGEAFSCFKTLAEHARETIKRDGPQSGFEFPVQELLASSGAVDVESVAQSIRQIIDCRVEMTRDDYLYFFPFFSAVRLENGMVTYSLPDELVTTLPEVTAF